MKKLTFILALCPLCLLIAVSVKAETAASLMGPPVSLGDFLTASWNESPVKTGEPFKLQESDERIKSVRGKYLPHVSIDAIDSTGFPASSSALQVQGIMGSPFRSGFAGGVVVEQTVFDFGRIQYALERAHAQGGVDEAKLADEKLRFLSMLGRLYLSCAQAVTVQSMNDSLMKLAVLIQKETNKFTRTGQRSIVDNELVQIEVDDLALQQKQLQELEKSLSEQMSIYSRKPMDCQHLSGQSTTDLGSDLKVKAPSVLLAQAQKNESESLYRESKALQLPKLNVLGSAGYMDNARLVERQDYALGIGIVFPLWDGGEEWHRESSLKSRASYQDQALKTAVLEYETWLKNLRDSQRRDEDVLGLLRQHVDQVRHTMDLATKRFFQLQGSLVDVRDTFTRLRAIENDKIQTEYTLAFTNLQLVLLDAKVDSSAH